MITVTFQNTTFTCSRAVKGVNYVRLYDENNVQVAAFEEVSDLSIFTISGGDWEAGRSTQRVAAEAILNENAFVLTLKEKVIVEDGLCVSFNAPADSTNITKITIDSIDYSFVNATKEVVATALDCFASGAKLEVILGIDGSRRTAYLKNGTASIVPVSNGGTGGDTDRSARKNLGVNIKTFTALTELGFDESASSDLSQLTIKDMVDALDDNSMLVTATGSKTAHLYPKDMGIVTVYKVGSTRTYFEFRERGNSATMWTGSYDDAITNEDPWSGWSQVYTTTHKPTQQDLGVADYIVEQGYDEAYGWNYRKWNSGMAEAWGQQITAGVSSHRYNDTVFYVSSELSKYLPSICKDRPYYYIIQSIDNFWTMGSQIVITSDTTDFVWRFLMPYEIDNKTIISQLYIQFDWK